jgi:hypothetical protein
MKHLQLRLMLLIASLAFVYGITLSGAPAANGFSLRPLVSILATVAVITILLGTYLPGYWLIAITASWIPAYFLVHWLAYDGLPLFGNRHTPRTLVEVALLAQLLVVAYLAARALVEFRKSVYYLTVLESSANLLSVETAREAIEREITRGRHYERPVSVIVVEPLPHTLQTQIDPLVGAVQKTLAARYARISLAGKMRQRLRAVDLILETNQDGPLLLLCPEADEPACVVLIDRVRMTLEEAGVHAHYATATFPTEGVTFDALVERAKAKLDDEQDWLPAAEAKVTAP